MYPIHRILLAIKDTRAQNAPAIAKAAQLARALGAELCLFHAIADPMYMDVETLNGRSPEQLGRQASARQRDRLQKLAEGLRRGGLRVTTLLEWDYPSHEAVIRAAAHFKADLIVAECHAKHVAPWLMHFTDWELLRQSPVPVLLVKHRGPYRRPKVLAAIDPGHAKPADLDEEILRYGATVAEALHGALHAVHAYNPLLVDMSVAELAAPGGMAEARAKAAAMAHAAVDPKLSSVDMPRARRHVVDGFAVDVIQNVAEEIHAGIVVMGAVSRSGLKRLLIGNTAERMLDRMTCDVLIVKPKGFPGRTARSPRGPQIIATRLLPGGVMH